MKILRTKTAVRSALRILKKDQITIGLVPTMGALHEGHLSLIEESKLYSDITLVSIFVNPAQFNNLEDFEKYPVTLEKDLELLEKSGVDLVFVPENKEMYSVPTTVNLDFGNLDRTLEGSARPGHFNGVGIVVSKLLNIVKPDKVYFGQKDLQQVAVIKRLIEDLSFDTEIVVVPTKREADGLALSSRNLRLDKDERLASTILFRCLSFAKDELLKGRDWFEIKGHVARQFQEEPKARLEYFELVDSNTLEIISKLTDSKKISVCTAAYIGEVRLIDNMTIID